MGGVRANFRNGSFRAKLMIAFAVLLVAASAMILLVAAQLSTIRTAVSLNDQSSQIVRLSHIAEKGLIRVNSQMRGTLLTGNFGYLDTYREGMEQFHGSVASLSRLVEDPRQHALLSESTIAFRDWNGRYGDRLVELARRPGGRAAATRILIAAGEKARITYITRMVAAIRDIEEQRVTTRHDREREAIGTGFVALAIGGVGLLGIAAAMAWLLAALIATPVESLTAIVDRLAQRDFTATVPADQRERHDEVGHIARSLEVFRTAGLENQRLETEAAALREARARETEQAAVRLRRDAERDRATIRILGEGLTAIAGGDLTFRLADGLSHDAAVLKDNYDAALDQLASLLRRVSATVGAVDRDVNGIADASERLAERTTQQSSAIAVVGERLAQVTDAIRQSATGARRVENVAQSTRDSAERSRCAVAAAVDAMGRIDASSEQIGTITSLVRSIAEQTRLLALNAQMEAARAGSAGSGFAVVAKEVSQLAARLREATQRIDHSVKDARTCVVEGVQLVGATSTSLGEILSDVGEVTTLLSTMAANADRQAADIREVDEQMREIARFTDRNAAMAGEARSISGALVEGARELARSLSRFRIGATEAA